MKLKSVCDKVKHERNRLYMDAHLEVCGTAGADTKSEVCWKVFDIVYGQVAYKVEETMHET